MFWGMLFLVTASYGQTASKVLDKTAAVVSAKSGVTASFTISSKQYGNSSGTISVKVRKFYANTSAGVVWFDGKTQWTYVKQNDEVNICTPTPADLQAINPYHFIYMYKKGYTATMTTNAQSYVVTLKATNKNSGVQEMVITINRQSYVPSQIKMLQGKQWTFIQVTDFKKANLSDSIFRFNPKAYPNAEIIDLR
ncbi:MAG: cell envelope biogenesis protein LolA [Prevotella sp.]|nr:cell envelope biogenesis protein LolA [Prevotella sp.]